DRDLNAAKHLEMLAERSSDRLNACGEGSAGDGLRSAVKLPSLKQEPNPFDASAENGKFWRTVLPLLHLQGVWQQRPTGQRAPGPVQGAPYRRLLEPSSHGQDQDGHSLQGGGRLVRSLLLCRGASAGTAAHRQRDGH